MAAEGMSLVKGGQETDDGKVVDGQQTKRGNFINKPWEVFIRKE